MEKLTYEIFSILENKFLYGQQSPIKTPTSAGRVRILSIDAASDQDLLASVALSQLESSLQSLSGDSTARIADFFDVVAGSGIGGVLAAMLFTRGVDDRPLFSAADALRFIAENQRRISNKGAFQRMFRRRSGIFRRMFGDLTLRDTVKPVLVPCYDMATGAPFLFSRADAMETDGYDFKIRHVCAATCADRAVEMRSVDGKTLTVAAGGGVATANPTAAAITHVLNNKQEFPFANGVEDLVVVSLGSGSSDSVTGGRMSAAEMLKRAESCAADTVDQAVAMAFGHCMTSNYLRIQANDLVGWKKKLN